MPFTQKNNRGRPTALNEQIRKSVIDKSWTILDEFFKSKSPLAEKRKVALEIAKRSIPTELTGLGGRNLIIKITGETAKRFGLNTTSKPKDGSIRPA